ncbi:hypothetical protein T265_13604, partial [Opisthorchis viverrini]
QLIRKPTAKLGEQIISHLIDYQLVNWSYQHSSKLPTIFYFKISYFLQLIRKPTAKLGEQIISHLIDYQLVNWSYQHSSKLPTIFYFKISYFLVFFQNSRMSNLSSLVD